MLSLKATIIARDGITAKEADILIAEAKEAMNERLANGELPFDICEEYFGLEEDYLMDLID